MDNESLFRYEATRAIPDSALCSWAYESYSDLTTTVFPDGCRDIIFLESQQQSSTWFLSDLSSATYQVPTPAGSRFTGLRLQPGVNIDLHRLQAWLEHENRDWLFCSGQLDEFCHRSDNLAEALACLATKKKTILGLCKELGVSPRTLQRLVKSGTDRSPQFWFSLARVRRAGRALLEHSSLAEIAADAGYADQAHMSRDIKKWLGCTPGRLRTNTGAIEYLSEPGFG